MLPFMFYMFSDNEFQKGAGLGLLHFVLNAELFMLNAEC